MSPVLRAKGGEGFVSGRPVPCLPLQVEDSEGSWGGQVAKAARTPPALKRLLVPGDALGEMRLIGG